MRPLKFSFVRAFFTNTSIFQTWAERDFDDMFLKEGFWDIYMTRIINVLFKHFLLVTAEKFKIIDSSI